MELPDFLPQELSHYVTCTSEEELFQKLIQQPVDCILFFSVAADDEAWSKRHTFVMRSILEWATAQFLQGHLSQESAESLAKAVWSHHLILRSALPLDLTLQVKEEKTIPVNSLMLAVSSDYLRDSIHASYRHSQSTTLVLEKLLLEEGGWVAEFVHTGAIVQLWKQDRGKITSFMQKASELKLLGAVAVGEGTLKRYIDQNRVFEMLIQSYQEGWPHLKQSCCSYINAQSWGITLDPIENAMDREEEYSIQPLSLQFLDFGETALALFDRLKEQVTEIACHGRLTQEAAFGRVIRGAPHLRSLDISSSRFFSESLLGIPSQLEALDLSECEWLTHHDLKRLIITLPHLKRINLASNPQLTYLAWGELQHCHALKSLDVSYCYQLRDEDLTLILKAVPTLRHLNLTGCSALTHVAIQEIRFSQPKLQLQKEQTL